ncbi:MAG: CAP domain-containing protein, partial [Desulfamplus sp.]|nr:CAP domain-containing protein [Desulfamplus sp.]
MNSLRKTFVAVCMTIIFMNALSGISSGSNCVSLYDIEPLAEEIYFLELINRARANPDAEALLYKIPLNEGVSQSSTISSNPKQPLAFNLNLYKAALAHSEDMMTQDYFSHYTNFTNASPSDRAIDQGYDYFSGENIAINMSTGHLDINQKIATYHHEILFVDENYPNRGHRVNMLGDSHVEAGVAFVHGDYEEWPNAVVSTSDFGRGENPAYICGVIYNDKNGNSFYDVGEGLPHVMLTIVETGQNTDAFSAGAYSLGV